MLKKKVWTMCQNTKTIIDLILNIIGRRERDLYDHLMSTTIFTLIMNARFIQGGPKS